jgi:hypothetical protein
MLFEGGFASSVYLYAIYLSFMAAYGREINANVNISTTISHIDAITQLLCASRGTKWRKGLI